MVQQTNDRSRHLEDICHPGGNPGVKDRAEINTMGMEVVFVLRLGAGCSVAEFAARRHALRDLSYDSSSSDEEIELNLPSLCDVRSPTYVGGRGSLIRPQTLQGGGGGRIVEWGDEEGEGEERGEGVKRGHQVLRWQRK